MFYSEVHSLIFIYMMEMRAVLDSEMIDMQRRKR